MSTLDSPESRPIPAVLRLMLKLLVVLAATWALKLVFQKYVLLRSVASSCRRICPGGTIQWLEPLSPAAIFIGSAFPPQGWIGNWFSRFSLYMKHGSTCISSVLFWDATPVFWVSNARAIKSVMASPAIFTKDVEAYSMFKFWESRNVANTAGADWKRHRSVVSPAFNEANSALVWQVTSKVLKEWFSEIDCKVESDNDVTVNLLDDLYKVTLLVISGAGFGRHASWREDSNTEPPPGHNQTFQNAVLSASGHLPARVLIPYWMHRLSTIVRVPFISEYLRETRDGFDAVKAHLLEVVGLARDCIASGRKTTISAALLQNLVEANMSQEGVAKHLSDTELLSNSFAFFLAGHETTAHALCFAVLSLAVYPVIQQRAYEEVHQLWPEDTPFGNTSSPSYKDSMTRLVYISAIFHEALRLFPPAQQLPRRTTVDTSLTAYRFSKTPDGKTSGIEEYEVPVKAGSLVVADFLGLHMNPLHWGDDVADFKPERFIDTDAYRWPRDAFIPFSSGPRGCIGQRFAFAESICLLAHLVRKYEICVPEESKSVSSAEQLEEAFRLRWAPRLSMTRTGSNPKVLFRLRCKYP